MDARFLGGLGGGIMIGAEDTLTRLLGLIVFAVGVVLLVRDFAKNGMRE